MNETLRHKPLSQTLVLRLRSRQYYAAGILVALFIGLLSMVLVGIQHDTTSGIKLSPTPAGETLVVVTVKPVSDAAEIGIKSGDLVLLVDGRAPTLQDIQNPRYAERANQLVIQRPETGRVYTLRNREQRGPLSMLLPYLLMGGLFLIVSIVSLLFGRGKASRALALLCGISAIITLNLPLMQRQILWSVLLNGVGIPLFMGSFAYLFLLFPVTRKIALGTRRLAAEFALLPAIPISIAYVFVLLSDHPLVLFFGRLLSYPYFLLCLLGGIGTLIYSWIETNTERTRAQMRLIMQGILLATTPFLTLNLIPTILGYRPLLLSELAVLPLALIPLTFGYAMLRYQVMNMHLYIQRGVVYSILGAIITGIYALGLAIATIAVRDRAVGGVAVVAVVVVALIVITGDRLRSRIQRHVDRLFDREGYDYRRQLLEFSQRMNSILDPDELAQSAVELIGQTMSARHVRLYLHDRNMGSFHLWAHAGTSVAPAEQLLANDHPTLAEIRSAHGEIVQHFEVSREKDALLVPLMHKGQPVALLTLGLKRADLPYSSEDISLLSTVASQLATATENAQLYGRMRALYLSGIRTLAATVDAKDSYTHGHSERVAGYARAIALTLGLPQLEVETIELAGLLHDIGKIGVPDAILQKPGRLDPDERTLIEQHADLGARILSDNPALMPLVPLVRHHHERWDGRGYPSGIRGEEIPIGAAIICVADTFDTMTTDRPYRRAPGLEEARAEIAKCSGGQFAPHVVEAFLQASISGHKLLTLQQKAVDQQPGLAMAGQAIEVNVRAMRIVYQIAQLLGTSSELSTFLKRVVEILRRELATKTVDFFIVDQATQRLANHLSDECTLGRIEIPWGQGLIGWVAEQQTAVRINDMRNDPRIIFVDGWEGRSELAVPLISEGRTIAVLNAESTRLAAFSDEDTMLLTIIAGQLAQVIEVANLHEEARRAARLDGLTGIANHRHLYDRLEIEVAKATRTGSPLAMAVIDVDGLKALNDTYGHLAGDAALRTLASTLDATSHGQELVARYGGDEFAIIFPEATEQAARERVATFQETLDRVAEFATEEGTLPLPKVSVGIAALGPEASTLLALVALADKRMYEHKDNMRVMRVLR